MIAIKLKVLYRFKVRFFDETFAKREFGGFGPLGVIIDFCMFIWSKLGQNLWEMDVSTFARIKKVFWDKLLAT